MERDLTGLKFGRLTVLRETDDFIGSDGRHRKRWLCKCDCGAEKKVRETLLVNGKTKSCGCFARDNMSSIKKKHGGFGTRLYAVWNSMRQRCLNKNHSAYKNYGARGISICKEWDNFETFRTWAYDSGYDDNAEYGLCTLDRIDVNKSYSPSNCRWITMKQQSVNRRCSLSLTYNGEEHSLTDWADITGIKYSTIWKRYKRGKPAKEILSLA